MVRNFVSILLSTYNCELFLKDQIDSLLSQTFKNWILYIRDDGSNDNTISLIEDYCNKYDKILFLKDEFTNLGAGGSFIRLLTLVDSQYYMFCDHDDVWLPHKIEVTLQKMSETESTHPDAPILIFTDLKVVDVDLNLINSSLWSYQRTNPDYAKDVYALSISNPVTGCTIMINQKAKQISLPMSSKSLMHDLWIALNVSHFGYVDFINKPTVLYRQHQDNTVGARKAGKKYYLSRLKNLNEALKSNLLMIEMINSLCFKMNHFKRIFLKIGIVISKLTLKI
jgi:glycosyltransferase involved in cell wall biosynthesis